VTEQQLVDLAPLARLMLLGILIALVPLAWVWTRSKNASVSQRLKLLTFLTLFLTFDLVLFGSFTRLTDSGLGCPDWPGCYGKASPVGAAAQIAIEQAAMPTGPVTFKKAWIEMIHRYLASGVGVLILVLCVVSWLERKRLQRDVNISPWWPTVTLVWVCMQGAFGALTVTMKLFPAIVTTHLLGGMGLLALLQAQAVRYAGVYTRVNPSARAWLLAGCVLLWFQIALGGWVSTNYAVLACTEFPMCQGQWVPPMNVREGFEIWRELGQTGAGSAISFPALTAIHVVHRMFAFIVFAALGVAAFKLWRSDEARAAKWIAALLALQLITGLSNVVLGWPLVAAVLHVAGAAGLVVVVTGVLSRSRPQTQSQTQKLATKGGVPA
jgi:heme a synthase